MNTNVDSWFHIPGYNGYQINPYRRKIRSMKMMYADPGHILKPYGKYGDTFVLTRNDNKRVRVKYNELYKDTFENRKEPLLKAVENSTYLGARNKAFTSNYNNYPNTVCIDMMSHTVTPSTDNEKNTPFPDVIGMNIMSNVDGMKLNSLIEFYDS